MPTLRESPILGAAASGGPRPRAAMLLCLGLIPITLAVLAPPGAAAQEQDHSQHLRHRPRASADDIMNVKVQLYDLELLTENGEPVRFESDVIGDKLVAMTFTYTTCTTICPIYGALFRQVQGLLGDRLGDEVALVTMSIDPTTDVPPRMKKEAERYGARPGWVHLTGEKQNVDQVLRGLDAYFADFTQHPPMTLVGDGQTGVWRRYNGFPQPQQVVAMLDRLKAERPAAAAAGGR